MLGALGEVTTRTVRQDGNIRITELDFSLPGGTLIRVRAFGFRTLWRRLKTSQGAHKDEPARVYRGLRWQVRL